MTKRKPNDQRADVKNPNNPAYAADRNNRANQARENNPQPEQKPASKPKGR